MKATLGKYKLNDKCDWCPVKTGLREVKVQTNGVKTKRYTIPTTACAECAARLFPDQ